MVRTILLTRGQTAIISDEDFEKLSKYKWRAIEHGSHFQAARVSRGKNGKPKNIFMHRDVWEIHNGPIPNKMEIDHIDRNSLNNEISNLRLASHSQNQRNSSKRANCSSKYKGVSKDKLTGMWSADIFYKKHITIGLYDTEEDAAKAYDEKARALFKEFANTNFPSSSDISPDNYLSTK